MQVISHLEKTEYNTSVALGFFDGVHRGHQEVIASAVSKAGSDCKSAVLTFSKSPYSALTKTHKPLLTTNEEKFKFFEELGVDIVYCIDFNQIKDMSAQEFVNNILHDKLNAKYVTTGFNYHFSKGGSASADDLRELCLQHSISVHKCPAVIYNDAPISSTRIRECIANGNIEDANQMLGYEFSVNAKIISGNHIGAKLDSPTINQQLNSALVTPRFGVYATCVTIDDKTYSGATNIGTHPTVGGNTPVCETHLLNFKDGDLYNKRAQTKLLNFIRPEKKFSSIDELKAQIERDKIAILEYFSK